MSYRCWGPWRPSITTEVSLPMRVHQVAKEEARHAQAPAVPPALGGLSIWWVYQGKGPLKFMGFGLEWTISYTEIRWTWSLQGKDSQKYLGFLGYPTKGFCQVCLVETTLWCVMWERIRTSTSCTTTSAQNLLPDAHLSGRCHGPFLESTLTLIESVQYN